jgi:signal peptidase II
MRNLGWLLLSLLVLAADQASKAAAAALGYGAALAVAPFLDLLPTRNHGTAMGVFLAADRWLMAAVAAAACAGLVAWMRRPSTGRLAAAGMALVVGGALGNAADRAALGYVVDFVHLHWGGASFWVFNLADAAISLGCLLLVAGEGRGAQQA